MIMITAHDVGCHQDVTRGPPSAKEVLIVPHAPFETCWSKIGK